MADQSVSALVVVAAVYWVPVVGTVNSRTVGVGSECWVAVVGAACWGTSSIVVGKDYSNS